MNFNFHSRTTFAREGDHVLLEKIYTPPTIMCREYDFNAKTPCVREARFIADHCVELLPTKRLQEIDAGYLKRAYKKFVDKGGIALPLEKLLAVSAPKPDVSVKKKGTYDL